MVITGAVLAALAILFHQHEGGLNKTISLALFSLILFIGGIGKVSYYIRPRNGLTLRYEFLSLPVYRTFINWEKMVTVSVKQSGRGKIRLQFKDASGAPSCAINGFKTEKLAHDIANLIMLDEQHLDDGIANQIEREVINNRELPLSLQWFGIISVMSVHAVIFLLSLRSGDNPGNILITISIGAFLIILMGYAVRKPDGANWYAKEERIIHKWHRDGLFHKVSYTQSLGEDTEVLSYSRRLDPWILWILMVCILHAGILLSMERHHSHNDLLALPVPETEPIDNSQEMKAGIKALKEIRKRREAESSETSPESESPQP